MMNKLLLRNVLKRTVLVILVVISCTKEVDVLTSFPFTIETTYNDNVTINYGKTVQFRVVPEVVVTTNVYSFSYRVVEGQGHFVNDTGDQIVEDVPIPQESRDFSYQFIPLAIGSHTVLVTVQDQEGRQESITLIFTASHNEYTWNATTTNTVTVVNQESTVNVGLFNTGVDGSVTYERRYYFLQGSGTMMETEENGGEEVVLEEWVSISEGTRPYIVTFDMEGESVVVLESRDSNGQVKTVQIEFMVSKIDFELTGAAESIELFLGSSTNFNFNIEESSTSMQDYEMRFVIDQGDGKIMSGTEQLSAGVYYDVALGAFSWSYESESVGDKQLTFFARNDTGVEKSVTLTLTVNNGSFNCSVVPALTDVNVNDVVNVALSVQEEGPTGAPYTFTYESDLNGTLTYNGATYSPGQMINMDGTTVNVGYQGLIAGGHNVIFMFTNQFGESKACVTAITFAQENFTFTAASSSTSLFVDDTADLNYNITGGSDNATYTVQYTVSGSGAGVITNGGATLSPGVPYEIPSGASSWQFKASEMGDVAISYTVTNNTGATENAQVNITINDNDLVFSATATANTAVVGGSVPINFQLTEVGNNSTFSMSYETTGSGSLTYDGTVYTPGQVFTVLEGSFSASYTGTNSGGHTITFTVNNNSSPPVSKTDNVTITYQDVDYTLTTSGDGTVLLNDSRDFNVFLSQAVEDSSISYEVRYLIGSGSTGSGTVQTPGGTDVPLGSFQGIGLGGTSMVFVATQQGSIELVVEVRDSNSVTKRSTINLNVDTISYSFSGAADSTTITAGEGTQLFFDISETAPSGSVYQMKYVASSGSADILAGGVTRNPNTWYDVNVGSYTWAVANAIEGTLALTFTARNATTLQEEMQDISIAVNAIPQADYTFTAIASSNTTTTNVPVVVNFSVNETVGTSGPYQMVLTTTGGGTLTYNGADYSQGEVVPLSVGGSSGQYTPTTNGEQTITFTASNGNGLERIDTVDLTASTVDFSLSTSGDGTVLLNDIRNFNVFLSQVTEDTSVTYEVRYLIDSGSTGSGTIQTPGGTDVPLGSFQSIGLGGTPMVFVATQQGSVELVVEVRDSNSATKQSTINLNVDTISYAFSGAADSSTITAGQGTDLFFDISETAPSGSVYQMKYISSSGSADILAGGLPRNPNTWYEVNVGSYTWAVANAIEGTLALAFTARNATTLQEETQDINITVNAIPDADYTFTAIPSNNSTTVNVPVVVNFNVDETVGTAQPYELVFTTTGAGTLVYNGNTYTQGQQIPLSIGGSSGQYTPTSAGSQDITFTAKNVNNLERVATATLSASTVDFDLSTSGDGTVILNDTRNFNVFLSQVTEDTDVTYEVRYLIGSGSTGSGTVETPGGTNVPLGTFTDTALGGTQMVFRATGEGSINLVVEVRDSNSVTKQSIINLNVDTISYAFSGTADSSTITAGQGTDLFFDISETAPSGSVYQMKYVVSSGGADILAGGLPRNPNTWYDVNVGSYTWAVANANEGTLALTFTARNTTTLQEETQDINITVNAIPDADYTFTAIPSSNSTTVNVPVVVNFNVNETVGTAGPYQMFFTTTGGGTLTYNGADYAQGEVVPLSVGGSSGQYTPTTNGEQTITFTANNANSLERVDTVTLSASTVDFNLSTSGDGTVVLNDTRDFNVFLSQATEDNDVTYEVRYLIGSGSAGSGTVETPGGTNVPLGTFTDIALGGTQMVFRATGEGSISLVVEVRDSNSVAKQSTVTITVETVSYTFSGAAQNSTINVGDNTSLNFDITETAPSGNQYEMKYVIDSGTGTITAGGQARDANTFYPVSTGAYSWNFEATDSGAVEILFTARNATTLEEETQTITVNVNSSSFTFTGSPQENSIFRTETTNLNFDVTESSGATQTYQMRYEIASGNAVIKDGSGTTLSSNTYYNVSAPGNFNWQLEGTTVGTVSMTFYCRSSLNQELPVSFSVQVQQTDFTLTAAPSSPTGFVDQAVPINFNITNQGIESLTYTMTYTSDIAGSFTIGGLSYEPGQTITVGEGTFSGSYTGIAVGAANLNFVVTASNSVSRDADVDITYSAVSFALAGASQENSIFRTETTDLNFSITEAGGNSTYEMRYVIDSGSATIRDGSGSTLASNTYYPVSTGGFNWQFEGTTVGTVNVTFYARNATGTEEDVTLSVVVQQTDFTFTAAPSSPTAFVNESVSINFNITNQGSETLTYSMTYTSDIVGSFTLGGLSYEPGQTITVSEGAFSGSYTGMSAGAANLKFVVTASNSVSKDADVDITFNALSFTLTGSPQENPIFRTETTDLNFDITAGGGSSTYEMRYVIDSGSATIRDGSGTVLASNTYYPVSTGGFNWQLEGTTVGTVNVTFYARNATGTEEDVTLSVVVQQTDFTFTAAPSSPTAFVNEAVPINFNITNQGSETLTYSMNYTSDISGTFSLEGMDYAPGEVITVTEGAFSGSYTGNSAGAANLNFVVTANNGVSKDVDVDIEFNVVNFNFSVSPSTTTTTTESNVDLGVNISESGESSTYEMRYTITTGLGITISESGSNRNPGTWYSVNTGTFNWSFNCSVANTVTLFFEARNATGVTKNSTVTITINEASNFTLSESFFSGFNPEFHINESGEIIGVDIITTTSITSNYEFKYEVISGNLASATYNGSNVIENTYYNAVSDNTDIQITASTFDVVTIRFTIKNEDDLEKSIDITKDVVFRLNSFQLYYHISNLVTTGSQCNTGSAAVEFLKNYRFNLIAGNLQESSPNNITQIEVTYSGITYTYAWNPQSISWTNRNASEPFESSSIPNSGTATGVVPLHNEDLTLNALGTTLCATASLQFDSYKSSVNGSVWEWTGVGRTFEIKAIDSDGNESNKISVTNQEGNIITGFSETIPYAPF